jgi:hypothetical protein
VVFDRNGWGSGCGEEVDRMKKRLAPEVPTSVFLFFLLQAISTIELSEGVIQQSSGNSAYACPSCCEYWPDDFTGMCPNWDCVDSGDPPQNSWCREKLSQVRTRYRTCGDLKPLKCSLNAWWLCLACNVYYNTSCSGGVCPDKSYPDPDNPWGYYAKGCDADGIFVDPCL